MVLRVNALSSTETIVNALELTEHMRVSVTIPKAAFETAGRDKQTYWHPVPSPSGMIRE
jgi:hypothetical protein